MIFKSRNGSARRVWGVLGRSVNLHWLTKSQSITELLLRAFWTPVWSFILEEKRDRGQLLKPDRRVTCSCVRFSVNKFRLILPGCTRRDSIRFTRRTLAFGPRTVRAVLGWTAWRNPRSASLIFCMLEMRRTSPVRLRLWLTSGPARRFIRRDPRYARHRSLQARPRITGTEYTWHPEPRSTRNPRLRRPAKTSSSGSIGYYPQTSSRREETRYHWEVRLFLCVAVFLNITSHLQDKIRLTPNSNACLHAYNPMRLLITQHKNNIPISICNAF